MKELHKLIGKGQISGRARGAKIVGCTHDEIVVEAPEPMKEAIMGIKEREMLEAVKNFLKIESLKVEVKNAECEDYDVLMFKPSV
ncbi:MAG: hypothetical protein AB1921_14065 [Thermodesulfobacteriota bacterium]